ncbi:DUF975 family protein [bacterium]|nr:DUF975 family protein [bacterium]MBQ6436287.1 DUF975 family protein [bacterium]
MQTRKELKEMAKAALKGNWTQAVLALFIYGAILGVVNAMAQPAGEGEMSAMNWLFWAVNIVISGPMSFGLAKFFMLLAGKKKFELAMLFDGFKHFSTTFVAALIMGIKTFLWGLLLIIPGIIAALRYSQTYFVLAENPNMPANEAIETSKKLMQGHLGEYFVLQLSFLGWGILAGLTIIGIPWYGAYYQTTMANYYQALKKA